MGSAGRRNRIGAHSHTYRSTPDSRLASHALRGSTTSCPRNGTPPMELSTTVPRSNVRLAGVLGHLDQLGAAAYGFLVVALVAASAGGYSQTTWGWAALATLWLGAVVLLARERIELGARAGLRRRPGAVRRLGCALELVDAVGAEHHARGSARARLHRCRRDWTPCGASQRRLSSWPHRPTGRCGRPCPPWPSSPRTAGRCRGHGHILPSIRPRRSL